MDLFMAFLTFIFLSLLTWYSFRQIDEWHRMKENFDQIICVKKFHLQTKKLIRDIHMMNQIISAETLIQVASLFFPPSWVAQGNLQKIKKATKLFQQVRVSLYLKDLGKAYLKKCPIDPRALRTPFQTQGLKLKRTPIGTTLLRRKKWRWCFPLKYQVICSQMSVDSSLHPQLKTNLKTFFLPKYL